MNSRYYYPIILLIFSRYIYADACRLETDEIVSHVAKRITNVAMVVTVCAHCEKTEPVPLRVRKVEFRHFEPETVSIPFYDEIFPAIALEEAEKNNTGALALALHAKTEKEYEDETGYLPNDPYLIQEKHDRYKLMLRFAREDFEIRVWDELLINGELINPALIYYPLGNNEYYSLGIEIGCDTYSNAPSQVTYKPVVRDPDKIAPPDIYIVDISKQCYDGSCPASEWTVNSSTPYFAQAEGDEIGVMDEGEIVKPLKTLSHVTGARAIATRDHDHIFEGDIFYLLDSQAEGFYRFWHYGNVFIDDAGGVRTKGSWNYCGKKNKCWAEAETLPSSTWWSKVKRQDGEIIWIRDPMQTLSGVLVD